jgi:hypothetical protein
VTRRHITFLFGGPTMIAGQVGLVASDGQLKGQAVAWASRSVWCHVVVAISETECVSAEPGGALVRPISFYPEVVWSRFRMTGLQRRLSASYARHRIGTPYAWRDYWAAGVALVTRQQTPAWLRAYIDRDDRLLCSQLADLSLQAAGIHVFKDHRPQGAVIPASFGEYFVSQGWTTTL